LRELAASAAEVGEGLPAGGPFSFAGDP